MKSHSSKGINLKRHSRHFNRIILFLMAVAMVMAAENTNPRLAGAEPAPVCQEGYFVFPADLSEIKFSFILNAPSGATVIGSWIATDVGKAAPANFVIGSTEIKPTKKDGVFMVSISKPTKGWPLGEYRLEIKLNGKVVYSQKFAIQ